MYQPKLVHKWQSSRLHGLLRPEHKPSQKGSRAGVNKQRQLRTVVGNRGSDTERTTRLRQDRANLVPVNVVRWKSLVSSAPTCMAAQLKNGRDPHHCPKCRLDIVCITETWYSSTVQMPPSRCPPTQPCDVIKRMVDTAANSCCNGGTLCPSATRGSWVIKSKASVSSVVEHACLVWYTGLTGEQVGVSGRFSHFIRGFRTPCTR